MAISPSYGVPDKLLHFIVAIFLDTFALVITAALADFCELDFAGKQPFAKKVT